MKQLFYGLLLTASLAFQAVAAEKPLVTFTVKDFNSLSGNVDTVFDAVSPGAGQAALDELGAALGIVSLEGIDETRPWQIALWMENPGSPPSVSFRVPVSDYATFENAYRSSGSDRIPQKVGDYANIWIPNGPESTAARAAHDAWKPEQLKAGADTLQLEVTPSEMIRQQMLGMLSIGRMSITSALGSQPTEAVPGIDMQAMVKIMGLYLDVIEVGVKGLQTFELGLDVANDTLRIQEKLAALPGSELASWLQSAPGDLQGLLPFLEADAPASFAMRVGESPAYFAKLKDLMVFSMEMQGMPADGDIAKQIQTMLDTMTPLEFAGSVTLDQGIQFAGLYRFPKAEAAQAAYAAMKGFLNETMQGQVGPEKLYKALDFKEAQREVQGIPIDRVTMEINLDSPMYQMPGQREMAEAMWAGGKMDFDYALQGRNLVVSSPTKTDSALERVKTGGGGISAQTNENTVLFARANFLKLIPHFMRMSPMLPPEAKTIVDNLKAEGTDVTIRADLDGAFSSETSVPIQLLRSIGNAVNQ